MGGWERVNLSETIFREFLEDAPIYDYHTHLSAEEIYEDKPFASITQAMLSRDHYKWRLMRYAGVPERYITGGADDLEKFLAWSKVCERSIGSPLRTWTELELRLFFGISERLTSQNAEEIYKKCQAFIETEHIGPRRILELSNVHLVCTTDDPTDNLEFHLKLQSAISSFKVLPTFRPDRALKISDPAFLSYLDALEMASGTKIRDVESLLVALSDRLKHFQRAGCRLSDHSVEVLSKDLISLEEANRILRTRLGGGNVSRDEVSKFVTFMLVELGKVYSKLGVIMQLHVGAIRNVNSRAYSTLGPDTGFDVPNDFPLAEEMALLLNAINTQTDGGLPKTIIYALNPKDYHSLCIIAQAFSATETPGHVQLGPAWWFNDTYAGIRLHLETLASQGLLSSFVGMVTDSRSYLSMVRHTYFRKILSEFLAEAMIRDGTLDEYSLKIAGAVATDLAWRNAKFYILGS